MKKQGNRKESRIFKGRSNILLIAFAAAGMVCVLFGYSDSVHSIVVEREMGQVRETAHYITETVMNTFEQCIGTLELVEEMFLADGERTLESYSEELEKFRDRSGFTSVGILKLDGGGIDSEGNVGIPAEKELYEAIRRNEAYISDILMSGSRESGQILIAVPLRRSGRIIGAVWGQYPISEIAEKAEEDRNAKQYFQIIDSEGRYINHSANVHAFARSLPLWEELERYEFPNGETVGEIRGRVENHESGQFYFKYNGQGRYVSYEPLGINNWYVFSIIVGDSLDEYVAAIQGHLAVLAIGFSAFLLIIFAAILRSGRENWLIVEEKNRELSVKSRLLWMVLDRTGDIPFEISIKDRKMMLYRHLEENGEQSPEILEDFSADDLLRKGWIRPEGYDAYRKLYEAVMAGRETEPVVLETKFDGSWVWKKLHLLGENKGTAIGFMEDYTDQENKEKQLRETKQKTKVDGLTGLYNREAFIGEVEEALEKKAGLEGGSLSALFLLDLDHFKSVNDTLGHLTGDRVLCDTAGRLRSSVRSSDFVGRIGGDEFVVFIQDAADVRAVQSCAQKLNRVLAATYEKDGSAVSVSASIGIAVVGRETAFRELYEKADRALYAVKREGRNGYRIADRE